MASEARKFRKTAHQRGRDPVQNRRLSVNAPVFLSLLEFNGINKDLRIKNVEISTEFAPAITHLPGLRASNRALPWRAAIRASALPRLRIFDILKRGRNLHSRKKNCVCPHVMRFALSQRVPATFQ